MFGFSWKRAFGISKAKAKVSRAIGIPLTASGRRQKYGKAFGPLWLLRMIYGTQGKAAPAAEADGEEAQPLGCSGCLISLVVLVAMGMGMMALCGGLLGNLPAPPVATPPPANLLPAINLEQPLNQEPAVRTPAAPAHPQPVNPMADQQGDTPQGNQVAEERPLTPEPGPSIEEQRKRESAAHGKLVLARQYIRLGSIRDARKLLELVVTEYGDTPSAPEAEAEISRLKKAGK